MSFRFIDLFCGGGGSITGAINALNEAGVKYEGRGFNHWDLAIKTIQMNHPEMVPDFEKACADIATISGAPQEVFDTDCRRLDMLWASPSCTHHSNAAGGTPRSNQLRSQPEHLLPFLRLTQCKRMFVENVKEYKEAFRDSFLKAKSRDDWQEQLQQLKAIPNFDADIFYEISGIKPEELN